MNEHCLPGRRAARTTRRGPRPSLAVRIVEAIVVAAFAASVYIGAFGDFVS